MPASTRSCRSASSLPRTRDDVVAAHQVAAEQGLAIIPRGGGTSLSGQSIGAGLILDFSKYMRGIEIDSAVADRARAAGRRARSIQRRRRAARPAVRSRRGHQQPRQHRRHDRQQLGRRTLDLARQNRRQRRSRSTSCLADGTPATFGPRTAGRTAAAIKRAAISSGSVSREVARIVADNRDEIVARFPAILRRVSGYNLDEFVPECRARVPRAAADRGGTRARSADVSGRRVQPGEADRRRRRHAGHGHRGAGPSAAAAQGALRHRAALRFDASRRGLGRRDPLVRAVGGRTARRADRATGRARASSIATISTSSSAQPESLVLVEFNGAGSGEVQAKADLLIERLDGQPGLVSHSAGAGEETVRPRLGLPQGGAAAAAWVAGHAQAGGVCRRRGRGARASAGLRRAILRDHGAAWHRRRTSTATPRSAACTFARCSTCATPVDIDRLAEDLARSLRPGHGVWRRDERRARRRTGPQLSERATVRPADLPGLPADQSRLRSRAIA